jgi:hypothetical protein
MPYKLASTGTRMLIQFKQETALVSVLLPEAWLHRVNANFPLLEVVDF